MGKAKQVTFEMIVGRIEMAMKAIRNPVALLETWGMRALSWAHQDYRAKGAGGQGGDGVTWSAITESAIWTRLLGRKPGKENLEARRELTRREKAIVEKELRRKLPKGKSPGAARKRRAIIAKFYEEHEELQGIRKARNRLFLKREQMIAREWANAQIGIDTGRLVGSLKFGTEKTAAGRARTKGALSTSGNTVVLVAKPDYESKPPLAGGAQVNYAKFFSEDRPIFGSGFITPARSIEMGAMGDRFIKRFLEGEG